MPVDRHPTTLNKEHFKKIPPDFFVHGVCFREDHGWTAIVIDFDVAGGGDTPRDAISDAMRCTDEYLEMCFDEGMEFEDTFRTAPQEYEQQYQQAFEESLNRMIEHTAKQEAFRQPILA